uniref:ferroxidase n=1 Tax=Leptobrachium leishanense TaxID=445787 RepID=A0A8C5LQ04_9ANUR
MSSPSHCMCTFAILVLLCASLRLADSHTRTYYIGIVEEEWDYAPSGRNLITGRDIADDSDASVFLGNGTDKIGRVYKKAIYKQFTNLDYNKEIIKPAWLGFLGPIIKAEVEDTIIVRLKNMASRAYTLHPHGVFYDKDSEGALYPDGTKKSDKQDDYVPPGGHHTYTWIVKQDYAPTAEDPNCLTWIYHSHIDAPKDIASGLIGTLLTCKKGTLDKSSNRLDVDKEFILMFSVVDENLSWYLQGNIATFCTDTVDVDDEDFQESNKMHSINGYLYGNLPDVDMCLSDLVSLHLFGIGNEVDIHSAFFHGHTVTNQGHRVDVINLFPATFVTVEMKPTTVGKWMLSCQVNDHIQAGMMGLYKVEPCGKDPEPPRTGPVKRYYIAAEIVLWNYAPMYSDRFTGDLLNKTDSDSARYFTENNERIGGSYWKVQYTEYVDEQFAKKVERSRDEEHLGILGPVIKAEVGDTIMVVFANKADRPYSIMAHGVSFQKDSEGANYVDGSSKRGARVESGDTFTYTWQVLEGDGPTTSDPSCLTYLYYSAVDPVKDTNSGLVGPLLVCKKDSLTSENTQVHVDKEFHLLFNVFDENLSWYLDKNINERQINKEDEEFQESNKMHAVNGYMYGNLPGLNMCTMENISWHLIGLGTEIDVHGVYFEGNTLSVGGMNRDTFSIFPHTTISTYMLPDEAGDFEVGCKTTHHNINGMRNTYTVSHCKDNAVKQYGTVRTYFIAAEEVEWDYSPERTWELERHATHGEEHESPGNIFIDKGDEHIGSVYRKVVYREYADGQFSVQKKRTPEEEHLGILGPFIRAEVGDSILIVFKNKASIPYSIYAHGVVTLNLGKGNGVEATPPGGTNTYRWNIPERSGPGTNDPDCLVWAYYSKENLYKDMYSGLVGPLLTCRKGVLNSQGLRHASREFALLFLVFDENLSWYLDSNIEEYVQKNPDEVNRTEEFEESNKMHAINGKIYGNLHGLTMVQGEKTYWYLLGLGSEIDMHTVHFHAQSFLYRRDKEHRADVFDLFPGTFQSIELVASNPGTWLLHCHVTDHIHAGMETTFTVKKAGEVAFPGEALDSNPSGVPFFGRVISVSEAHIALICLLAIGLLLLVLLMMAFALFIGTTKRARYNTIHHGSLPFNNL